MQNVHDLAISGTRSEKKIEMVSSSDFVKFQQGNNGGAVIVNNSQRRDVQECPMLRVLSSVKDQHVPFSSSHVGGDERACHVIANKYVLLDNVEGSSLCRCLDIKTQEELVCKVRMCFLCCGVTLIPSRPTRKYIRISYFADVHYIFVFGFPSRLYLFPP